MMRTISYVLLAMTLYLPAYTQAQGEERLEKVRAQKAAYLTTRLGLTTEESQKFWPVYTAYEDALIELRTSSHKHWMRPENLEKLSDAELEKLFETHFSTEEKELALKREYHKRFVEILGARKVAMLYRSERDFRKELIDRFRERKGR